MLGISLASLTMATAAALAAEPTTRPTRDKYVREPVWLEKQLPRGDQPNTFRFEYPMAVLFVQPPDGYPMRLFFTRGGKKEGERLGTTEVCGPERIVHRVDLPAGEYRLWCEPAADESVACYHKQVAFGVSVGADGRARYREQDEIWPLQKVQILSPANSVKERVAERRPILRWKPLPHAAGYRVVWEAIYGWNEEGIRVVDMLDPIKTNEPHVALEQDLIPGLIYAWRVEAYDDQRQALGLSEEYMFKLAGTPPPAENKPHLRQEPP
jgi:hypothetical protein